MPTRNSRASGGNPPDARRSRVTLPQPVATLVEAGFCVLPVRSGSKVPALKTWSPYTKRKPTQTELQKWFGAEIRNLFVVTGRISGVVVLDIDSEEGEQFWRALIGAEMDATTASSTGKGTHYWFKIGDERVAAHSGTGYDFRGEGTGVVAPPSIHPSGKRYAWIRDLSHLQPLPDALRRSERAGSSSRASSRSVLSELLNAPAIAGGRNDWLTRVAGHYAKTFRDKEDAYRMHVEMANGLLKPPLDAEEVTKVTDSVWKGEKEHVREAVEAQGWLKGANGRLYSVDSKGVAEPFGDFDMEARGFAEGEGWLVDLHDNNGVRSSTILTPAILADRRRIDTLLGTYGFSLGPGADRGGFGRVGGRITRYLKVQNPPRIRVLPRYDFDKEHEGFVTPDGIIRAGSVGYESVPVMAAPRDRSWSYGFVEPATAREWLSEVLYWHDETVVAVFGAWWAACLVKHWIEEVASQFPVMALQAPSESGKSRGFFQAMMGLNGNQRAGGDSTKAGLRDSLASNRAGIVWVDDSDHPEGFRGLLRQVTVGGTMTKKSPEFAQETAELVNPLLISGESVSMHGEKALLDRTIVLQVPGVKDRHDPRTGEWQWDAIVRFKKLWPDFTQAAGTLMAQALLHKEVVDQFGTLRVGAGRSADKWTILRVGARLLERLSNADWIVKTVDAWLPDFSAGRVENDNKLTSHHLPNVLAATGSMDKPRIAMRGEPCPTPVFVSQGVVWFHPKYLGLWVARYSRNLPDDRVDSEDAIRDQAHALGISASSARKNFRLVGGGMAAYWGLSQDLSGVVVQRSTGVTATGESQL